MSASGLPSRLKHDAVAEALLELRFNSEDLAEVVIGKLVSNPAWADFRPIRLPTADIPIAIRQQDPNLIAAPIMELQEPASGRIIKLGSNVLSIHILPPYPGWEAFRAELNAAIVFLFNAIRRVSVHRIGLKYINAFDSGRHGINSVADLALEASVAGQLLTPPLNLNYMRRLRENFSGLMRVASPEFVSGPPGLELTALVDVDIFTPDGHLAAETDQVSRWVDEAHLLAKVEFFQLLPAQKLETLLEA